MDEWVGYVDYSHAARVRTDLFITLRELCFHTSFTALTRWRTLFEHSIHSVIKLVTSNNTSGPKYVYGTARHLRVEIFHGSLTSTLIFRFFKQLLSSPACASILRVKSITPHVFKQWNVACLYEINVTAMLYYITPTTDVQYFSL
jgi:hypothetical protein